MGELAQKRLDFVGNSSSSLDLISYLPNDVIDNILVHLPLRDAVRTSVLSKKWMHNWTTIPHLLLDGNFERNFQEQGRRSLKKLLLVIYQVLVSHRGPVRKFVLSLSQFEMAHEINRLFKFLSRNGIQDVSVLFNVRCNKLPSLLFSCLELQRLHLSNCILKSPPTFCGFKRLISFHLENATANAVDIVNFISQCPLLEHLSLQNCIGAGIIIIMAPNLKSLEIKVAFMSICFEYAPLLTKASIDISLESPEDHRVHAAKIFCCLPNITYLSLCGDLFPILVSGNLPKKLPTTLYCLKNLEFKDIFLDEMDDVSLAFCLIRNSPNLQKLEFRVPQNEILDFDAVSEFLKLQDCSDISLYHLKEVVMECFGGSRPEMELVKFLALMSPSLEKVYIKPNNNLSTNEVLRILKEIMQFRRSSGLAQFIYVDGDT